VLGHLSRYTVLLADVLSQSAPGPAGVGPTLARDDDDDDDDGAKDSPDRMALSGIAGAGGVANFASGVGLGGFHRKQMDALCQLLEEHVGPKGMSCLSQVVRRSSSAPVVF